MPLTPKQQRFVDEYLIDLNATKAAIRAGYKPSRAEQTGCDLVRNRKVAEAIASAQQSRRERTQVTQDEVVTGLRTQADFYGKGSSHAARVSAWIGLAKVAGIVVDRKEVSGPGGGPIPHEHSGSVSLVARLDALAAAFEGAADREEEGGPASDGVREPVDPGTGQGGAHPQAS